MSEQPVAGQENGQPLPAAAGEILPPHNNLQAQLQTEYLDAKAAQWARQESSFWGYNFQTETRFLKDGIRADLGATTPSMRRSRIRTANEIGLEDTNAFANVRVGKYATSIGEVQIDLIGGDGRGPVREHWLNADEDMPKPELEAAELPGDEVVREVMGSISEGQLEFMSQTTVGFKDDPELLAVVANHSVRNAGLRGNGYKKIDNASSLQAIYDKLEPILPGDAESLPAFTPGLYYNADNQLEKIVLPTESFSPYHYVLKPENPAEQTSLTEGQYHLGYVVDPSKYAMEVGNNRINEAPAFIFGPDAAALCGAFEQAGLTPADGLKKIMKGEVEDRYGHAYSHLSFELCEIVNRGNEGLTKLFEGESVQAIEASLRNLQVDEQTPGGAKIIMGLLTGIANRTGASELPVSEAQAKEKKILDMCKDVESYYAGATMQNKLFEVEENSVPLLHKTHGKDTYMLRRPTMFNGVELPAGTVMAQLTDGWAAGRVSAYAVATQEDDPLAAAIRVYGAQMEETLGQSYRDENTRNFISVSRKLKAQTA